MLDTLDLTDRRERPFWRDAADNFRNQQAELVRRIKQSDEQVRLYLAGLRKVATAERRRARDRERARIDRDIMATIHGRIIKRRTTLKFMSPEDRAAHIRQRERDKKRKQRGFSLTPVNHPLDGRFV